MVKHRLIAVATILIFSIVIVNANASVVNPDLTYPRDIDFIDNDVNDYINIDSYSPAEFNSDQATKDYLARNEMRVRAYDYRIEKLQEDKMLTEAATDEEINAFPERYEEYTQPTKENPSPYENIFDIWENR